MANSTSMQSQTDHLILEAEREAQLVSAIARLVITAIATAIFLAAGGLSLVVYPVVLTYLATYGIVSVVSAVFSQRRFFNPSLGMLFTAVDGISLALLIGFALKITGTPIAFHAAVPGFVFVFCILILASMRYTIGPTLIALISFSATWIIFSNLADDPIGSVADPTFFFGTVQNAARWGFLGIATLLGLLSVIRRRRTLEAAIAAAHATANLSRYLPEQIAAEVARQGNDALSSGKQQDATILFVDIRGFTSISERLAPVEIGEMLSMFRSIVQREVERHAGIVDKFIGDAVMVIFGVPDPDVPHERHGLACALKLLKAIETWNTKRHGNNLPEIRVTIGLHCGEVFSGTIGTEQRLEFTVLGDTVNIAARLQEVAKDTDSGLVVSKTLLERSGQAALSEQNWRAIDESNIRGRSGKISLFQFEPKNQKA